MSKHLTLVHVATVVTFLLASPLVSDGQIRPLPPAIRPGGILPTSGVACLHDGGSIPANQARRADAQALARAINDAESRAVSASRRYVPLDQLPNLPPVPRGFELRFYTDGAGYVVSLKDSRDPCRYGLFTDQGERLYEMSPQVPQIAS
jgi:hypothetical protein